MKSIIVSILIITLLGCKEQKEIKDLSSFESIDYSFYLGYFQSIRILSNGATNILDSSGYSDTKFYSFTLDKTVIDSLSKMTKMLFTLKLDSIYQSPIADHPISFSLIIKTKEKTILTSYSGDLNESKWNSLFQLVNYLGKLCKEEIEHVDSKIVFESKSRLILPPPPPSGQK
jgi:hypothetical protein